MKQGLFFVILTSTREKNALKPKEESKMESYWLFLVPAIVCALFSGQIDRAFHADRRLQKVLLVFAAGVFAVSAIGLAASLLA